MTIVELPPSTEIRFAVMGEPSPQAGMREVPITRKDGSPVLGKGGRPMTRQITTGGKDLQVWRDAVAAEAERIAREQGRFPGAVEVWMEFRFRMPPSRPKWLQSLRLVPKTTKPDGDKLQRAIWDSLTTSGLIPDDAKVVRWHGAKVESVDGWLGVDVQIMDREVRRPEVR